MQAAFGERLGYDEDPYLVRWYFATPLFSIRLHHWRDSDDHRHPHDHNWKFAVFVLKGSYDDRTPVYDGAVRVGWKREHLKAGSFRVRQTHHRHYVDVKDECWSLVVTGPDVRKFGFWIDRYRWMKANKYFFEYGHHAPRRRNESRKTRKVAEGVSVRGH